MSATVQLVEESSELVAASYETPNAEAARSDADQVVPAVSPAPDEPRYGRAAVRGGAIGCLMVVLLTSLLGIACGLELATVLGLAVFVGLFGGVGFGAMLGASLCMMLTPSSHP